LNNRGSDGAGENSAFIREKICASLGNLGFTIDLDKNQQMTGGQEGSIKAADSKLDVWVIPTNEELLIARDSFRCIQSKNGTGP